MYLNRTIDKDLIDWKFAKNRKPLILRGARQVGKTSSVKKLATHFSYFVEINFDENPSYSTIFEKNLSVFEVCKVCICFHCCPIKNN